MGVENAYFPMFVAQKVLEREKDHIEGFSPEVAWVTRACVYWNRTQRCAQTDPPDLEANQISKNPSLSVPRQRPPCIPVRPIFISVCRSLTTAIRLCKVDQEPQRSSFETQSVEQRCSVGIQNSSYACHVSKTIIPDWSLLEPFIRTREFLWQEGHTAHLTKAEADKEVLEILDLYRLVFEELLAVPVIPGVKSEKEKFAGAVYTTTVEGFIPTTGRGIQGATSHCLGQNFSRPEMFNIFVEDPNDPSGQRKIYVSQNSWGLSTRTIGVMVMVHGDNQGLVLPPRVASVQVIIVPCGITAKTAEEQRQEITAKCEELVVTLRKVGVRARADLRDGYTPGYKFNDWEQKGVPLRLEIGPQDLAKKQTLGVRRDTGVKAPIPLANVETAVPAVLETIQNEMFARAKEVYWSRVKPVTEWEKVVPTLDDKCVVVLPWCEVESCEDDIKERSGRA